MGSYVRKGFPIYEEMRKYLTIYDEAISPIYFAPDPSEFQYIWGNFFLLFYQCGLGPGLSSIYVLMKISFFCLDPDWWGLERGDVRWHPSLWRYCHLCSQKFSIKPTQELYNIWGSLAQGVGSHYCLYEYFSAIERSPFLFCYLFSQGSTMYRQTLSTSFHRVYIQWTN